jgi:hypothetical protein
MIWVQARDADERTRLEESVRAAGIQSFNSRQEGDVVGVSWQKIPEVPAADAVAATLKEQGFKVAAIGQHG